MEIRSDTEHRSVESPPRYVFPHEEMKLFRDLGVYFRAYARERPRTVALTCLAVGFVLGWKLKP